MKKVLTLLLILTMCLSMLTSCFGSEWNERNDPPEEVPGGEVDEALVNAANFLYNLMKDKEGAANVNDFDVVAKLVVAGVTYKVTWKTDSEKVAIVASTNPNYWTVDIPTVNDAEFSYKLTATVENEAGQTVEKVFNRKVPVITQDNELVVSDPKEGVEYKLFIVQYAARKALFLQNKTQNDENKFVLATEKAADGAIFFVEKATGGVKIYTMVDGAKNYLSASIEVKNDGKTSKFLGFSTEDASVFFYKANVDAWFTMVDNQEYVIGTYGSYLTASLSEGKFMTEDAVANKEQFAVKFMTKASSESFVAPDFGENNEPADGTKLTIAEAIALGNTFVKNSYSSNKFVIEGEITEIQSDVYGNVLISDGKDTILIYGMYTADGTRFDKMNPQPKVGDKIVVKGIVGKYNDPQVKDATLLMLNDVAIGGGESEGISLNMNGTETRTEYSTEKTVHSANGVTYTNEKASSTTNNYDQTSNYAARAYKSSVITISAEKDFLRVVFNLDDYVTPDGKDYVSGFDGMTVAGATITRDGAKVTVVLAAAAKSITFQPLLAQIRIKSIEVFDTAGSGSGEAVDVGTSLNMMGTTTRTEYSTDKTVHSANGVTYTNEKNTSTTNNYDQTKDYAARAYAGSKITISAEKDFLRIVFLLDDYVPEAGKDYVSGFDGMTLTGATVSRDGAKVTVVLDAAAKTFTFEPLLKQIRIESITVYATKGEAVNPQPPAGGETTEELVQVTAPVAGVGYYLRLYQGSLKKNLYLNGNTANQAWYLASVENYADAVLVYLEAVDGVAGGFRLYFDKAGVKTYIRVYERSAGSGSLELVTTAPEEYFTFDTTLNTLVYTKGENGYILNTYSTFDTFCVSHISRAPDNFVSGLYAKKDAAAPHVHDYKATVIDPTCTEAGYTENKCACGDSYKDAYTDALGHKDENGDKVCDGCGIDRETYSVVDAPVVGVPYFLGLVQEKLGHNLYFNGKLDGKFLATEKSAVTAGLRVFLEAVDGVDGAYRLYFITEEGKFYVRVYETSKVDGEETKYSGALAIVDAAPAEYYAYDAELKTLVYTSESENAYYIGTYNKYDTLSASNVSFAATSFVSHFYALNVTGHHSYAATETVDPTCTAKGYTVYTCACGDFYHADFVDPIPHFDHNDDKFCDGCGKDVRIYDVLIGKPEADVEYYLGINQGNLGKVLYFSGELVNKYYLGTVEKPLDGVKVYFEEFNEFGGRLYFFDAEGVKTYIRVYERDAENKKGSLEFTTILPAEYFVYDDTLGTLVYNAASGNGYYLGTYGTYDTLSVSHVDYATKSGNFIARLYTIAEVPHEHVYGPETVVAPNCTEAGYTKKVCPCGDVAIVEGSEVAALGHADANFDKACDDCGASVTANLNITGPANRTEFSNTQMVYKQNGVTMTVDKAKSTSNCYNITNATYAARLYQGMVVTIAGEKAIDKIVITLYGTYVTGFDGMVVDGYAFDRDGNTLTIYFLKEATSFVSANLLAQVRAENIEVYYANRGHAHDYQATVTAPKCEEDGFTTYACVCGNAYVADITEKVGHKDENGDAACDACGTAMSTTTYVKIDSLAQLVDGQYVIVGNGFAPTVFDSSNWVLPAEPVITDGTLTDPKDAIITITVNNGQASLMDANGKYFAPKGGNNNGIKGNTSAYWWDVSVDGGKFIFAGTGSDTVKFACNHDTSNGKDRFRGYKNTTVTGSNYTYKFDLYQVVEG